ncbi:MAG: fasciclin domain-containing protein [Gemmatimonadota bacterium]|nr:fasciclin domain-containing protein [Gemmatimonadota bacterium]MDH5759156.1 fasciclin domain-containing protein [Gemmatimonadota bacterium]
MSAQKSPFLFLLSASTLVMCVACGSADSGEQAADDFSAQSNRGQAFIVDANSKPNILNIAVGSPDHTTLVAAVQAASLENVLVNAGPLTVFAPVNAAFDALPEGTLDELLKPENKQTLANIVTSHAAPGKFPLEFLKDGMELYMATGHYLPVEVREDGTYVNGAKILASVEATNGMVHVVGQVFLVAAN